MTSEYRFMDANKPNGDWKIIQEQSAETLAGLKLIMTWVPLAGVIISLMLVSFYPIDKIFHQKLIQDITDRKLVNAKN